MWSDRNVSELLEGSVKEEKKGSLARKEREDKMPTKYLCSWLAASGEWDINNCDDCQLPGRGGRHRLQPRLQRGLVL